MYKGKKPARKTGNAMDKAAKDNAIEQLKSLLPALQRILSEHGGESHEGEPSEPMHEQTPVHHPAEKLDGAADAPEEEGEHVEISAENEGEPSEEGGEGEGEGDEVSALIEQIRGICEQLEASQGGEAHDDDSMDADEDDEDDDKERKPAEDRTEGLQQEGGSNGGSVELDDCGPTKNPKASPGPKGGRNTNAADAALQHFYADNARKATIYNRLSKVVGAFDSASMASADVAKYGVKKLGIKCKDGAEFDALDAYLRGLEQGQKVQQKTVQRAQDAAQPSGELESYLKSLEQGE